MVHLFFKATLSLLAFVLLSCNGATSTGKVFVSDPIAELPIIDSLPLYPFRYDLDNPAQSIQLPYVLREISGLSLLEDKKSFYAIQDEAGIIFKVDSSGKITEKYPFWKPADYEDITRVADTLFVVKKTGTLYKVINLGTPTQYVEKYNTLLSSKNNVEGLCYDEVTNSLLLACKGNPFWEEDRANDNTSRAIYRFSLTEKKIATEPAFKITLKDIQTFINTHRTLKSWHKFDEYFNQENKEFKISPSAIARHPITNHFYILSSRKKLILIMDDNNQILHIEKLDKKFHKQPEGLTFAPNGDMYISNEGEEGRGSILRYVLRSEE